MQLRGCGSRQIHFLSDATSGPERGQEVTLGKFQRTGTAGNPTALGTSDHGAATVTRTLLVTACRAPCQGWVLLTASVIWVYKANKPCTHGSKLLHDISSTKITHTASQLPEAFPRCWTPRKIWYPPQCPQRTPSSCVCPW